MLRISSLLLLFVFAVILTSCQHSIGVASAKSSKEQTMFALHSDKPIKIDGILDEKVWDEAVSYELKLPFDRPAGRGTVEESGYVKLAWDSKYLYVGICFKDSDAVAEGKSDQQKHYALGDVCEVFLKPDRQTWYWELFVTPMGKKSNFFWAGRSYVGLPSGANYKSGLIVAASVDGTLNNWTDKDKGWYAEMAMPISDLTARDEKWEADGKWEILVARQNRSRYLSQKGTELSSIPRLTHADFHNSSEYAILVLQKKQEK